MRILFLGYVVSEADANQLSGASIAGNRMQLGLLGALAGEGIKTDAITVLPVASFPGDARLWISGAVIDLDDARQSKRVGFLNLPVAKQITQIVATLRSATGSTRQNEYDYVLTYNMFPQVGVPAWIVSRIFRIPLVCLLADPPIDHLPNRRGLSRALMHFNFALTRRLLRSCDAVIALNGLAAQRYAPNAARLVMDGAVQADVPPPAIEREDGRKRVVFTGALVEYNGIFELVDAMNFVHSDDIALDVYGTGPLEGLVREAARLNSNINYLGFISSDRVASIQRDAFLLINPRRVDDPMSQLTFPSKMFEYMLSGTPVLSTRLNGFTDEYEDKLYFVQGGSGPDIAAAIDDLAGRSPDELRETGVRAQEFILAERSWTARGSLIHRFLSGLTS